MADHNRAHAHNRSLPNGEALLDGCIDTKVGLTYSSRDDYLWDKEADGEEGGFELNVVEV